MIDGEAVRAWMQALAPWVSAALTVWVAYRVKGVHRLVNSEMTLFREKLLALAEADRAGVFRAGQQSVRSSNEAVITKAAEATTAAAQATTAAARVMKEPNA